MLDSRVEQRVIVDGNSQLVARSLELCLLDGKKLGPILPICYSITASVNCECTAVQVYNDIRTYLFICKHR